MKYPKVQPSTSTPAVTGAVVPAQFTAAAAPAFFPWQPTTWPTVPKAVDAAFIATLKKITDESMLSEIQNVIDDAHARNGSLTHRGHVVAIVLMCALDAVSAYGYRGSAGWKDGAHIESFIANHFPASYRPHAASIRIFYRNCLVHGWNLLGASMLPGNEPVTVNGTLSFGLLNFFAALQSATEDFWVRLATDAALQKNALDRYRGLRTNAK